ncbi:MAG: gliding motility-associated C-terminal domain-containing protein [Flavobacteriales bacterium]|nr:gliding motility-associated C-terminal domain-containing protein [Flavobacteriales bacterium]
MKGIAVFFLLFSLLSNVAFGQKKTGDGGFGSDSLNIFIPNAFTPDNNGLNDSFGVVLDGAEIDFYEFIILDRFGKEVFYATNPELRWNGTSAESSFTSGASIFTYILKIKSVNEQGPRILNGHVVMIR